MCRIGINLINNTPNGTNIVSAIGQYRAIGSATWINFPIILNNPQTPDLTVLGSYELRVNVTNNANDTSEWSNISTFQISSNCAPVISGLCEAFDVKLDGLQGAGGTVNYVNCDGIPQVMTVTNQLSNGVINFCSIGVPTTNGDLIIGGPYNICATDTTGECYTYELYAVGGYGDVIYTNCLTGNSETIFLDGSDHFGIPTSVIKNICSSTTPILSGGQGNAISITRQQICN